MRKFKIKSALAAGLGLACMAVHAGSFVNNDLYLGFTDSGASSDYLIDLGQPGAVGIGGSSVVNLSGDFSPSLFNSLFTSGANGVSMGVVGGDGTFGSVDVYTTEWRTSGINTPSVSGSLDLSNPSIYSDSSGSLSYAADRISAIQPNLPSSGTGLADSNKSFYNKIAPTFSATTFYGATGIEPLGTMDSSSIVRDDLWQASAGSPYKYLGYFTMDMSGSSPSLTFTPSAVPEPSAVALIALAGLIGIGARRFGRKAG